MNLGSDHITPSSIRGLAPLYYLLFGQLYTMPHSHHSHSGEFCKHGNGRLEDMILEAKRKGFKMYALTEHCPRWREEDLYDEEVKVG